jgi:hypothetical protein
MNEKTKELAELNVAKLMLKFFIPAFIVVFFLINHWKKLNKAILN